MEQALEIRQNIIYFYKQHELFINVIGKFIIGLFVFLKLSNLAAGQLSNSVVIILGIVGGIVTAVVPPTGFYILTMLGTGVFLSFASMELALCAMVLFFLIIVFYSRIFPQESLLIPAMLIAFYFNVPFAVPIFAGIYIGVIGIIPIAIAAFLWGMLPYIKTLIEISPRAEFSPLAMPDHFIKLYVSFLEILEKDSTWAVSAGVFSLAVIVGAVVAHLPVNYSRLMSLVISDIVMIIGFLIAAFLGKSSISVLWVLVGSIISVLIVWGITFFDKVLDYPKSHRVEFEDNDNYYYVKVVPKVIAERHRQKSHNVAENSKSVGRKNAQSSDKQVDYGEE